MTAIYKQKHVPLPVLLKSVWWLNTLFLRAEHLSALDTECWSPWHTSVSECAGMGLPDVDVTSNHLQPHTSYIQYGHITIIKALSSN